MQSHPTTGTPHNQQVVSTQVETIFMLDELKEQIAKLNETIDRSEKQNQKLELSNYKLQWAMFVLTAITTGIVAFPVIQVIFKTINPSMVQILNMVITSSILINAISFLIPILISILIIPITFKFEKKFSDRIKLKDSINVVLKDKHGRIKEIR